MKRILGMIMGMMMANAPLGAVVVIAPAVPVPAAAPARPPAPVDSITNDPATWAILGLGLGVVMLVARTTRQPRSVTV